MKTYSSIGAYITDLRRNQKQTKLNLSTKQLPDDGFPIKHDSILLPFIHEPHCDCFLPRLDNDYSDTEADSGNECIIPEQPSVLRRIFGTPHLDNRLAGKPRNN
jgi:hypothetical protein